MDSATSLAKEQERAAQQVDRFVRRFEPSYRLLAYYAALPLVITPELLNYLRNQFLRSDKVPWVAEVDLLLSDLCRPVGYEQYAMDTAVRAYLFNEMERELGYPKIEAASRLLINYIHHLAQTNPYLGQQELEAQQWAAMAYLEDQRSEVVRQIARAYQDSSTTDKAGKLALTSRAEMVRLSRITQELAPQLREYASLLAYAELVRRFLEDPNQVSTELLTRSYKVLEDVELRVPEPWLPTGRRTPEAIRNRWALLVGVNHYTDNAFVQLKFCINDALAMEQRLRRLGYTTICLHDQREQSDPLFPTRHNIEAALNQLCSTVEPDDLVVVYFSCNANRVSEQSFLVTWDTRYLDLENTALPISAIATQMRNSKARRLVLLLDTDYADIEVEGIALMAATTSQQLAQEWDEVEHGVFTYFILEGLKYSVNQRGQGLITVNDLQTYVLEGSRRWSTQHRVVQEPIFRVEGFGEIILADYRLPLQSFEFDVATVEGLPTEPLALQPFDFEIVTVEIKKSGGIAGFGRSHQVITHRRSARSQQVVEDLGNGISLEMVAIPGGSFVMGAPATEAKSTNDERPQHDVRIQPFFIGKYPVTQAEWQAVAALPPVNRELSPDPSRFKGSDRPVERVSWYDAVEFCDRLSQLTGRPYRLPSEAEWEYACRAGTTTPFHFGETITPDLANYDGNYTYAAGPKGVYREGTTPVGSFPANAFGLYDMHGNVWEWCLDHWHGDYKGAPTDGSAWATGGDSNLRLLRGGSWDYVPGYCRSASRSCYIPDNRLNDIGFRVVCAAARTQA